MWGVQSRRRQAISDYVFKLIDVDRWAWPPRLRHSSRTKRETRDRRAKLNIWDVDELGRGGEEAGKGLWSGQEGPGDANVKEMSRAVHEQWGIP